MNDSKKWWTCFFPHCIHPPYQPSRYLQQTRSNQGSQNNRIWWSHRSLQGCGLMIVRKRIIALLIIPAGGLSCTPGQRSASSIWVKFHFCPGPRQHAAHIIDLRLLDLIWVLEKNWGKSWMTALQVHLYNGSICINQNFVNHANFHQYVGCRTLSTLVCP